MGFTLFGESVLTGPFYLPCDPSVQVDDVEAYLDDLQVTRCTVAEDAYRFYLRPLTNDDLMAARQTAEVEADGFPEYGRKIRERERQRRTVLGLSGGEALVKATRHHLDQLQADGQLDGEVSAFVEALGALEQLFAPDPPDDLPDEETEALKHWLRWSDAQADAQLHLAVERIETSDGDSIDNPIDGFLARLPRTLRPTARGQLLRMIGALTDLVPEKKARSWPQSTSPSLATNSTAGSATSASKTPPPGARADTAAGAPSGPTSKAASAGQTA